MTLLRIARRWPRTAIWSAVVAYAAYVAWVLELAR